MRMHRYLSTATVFIGLSSPALAVDQDVHRAPPLGFFDEPETIVTLSSGQVIIGCWHNSNPDYLPTNYVWRLGQQFPNYLDAANPIFISLPNPSAYLKSVALDNDTFIIGKENFDAFDMVKINPNTGQQDYSSYPLQRETINFRNIKLTAGPNYGYTLFGLKDDEQTHAPDGLWAIQYTANGDFVTQQQLSQTAADFNAYFLEEQGYVIAQQDPAGDSFNINLASQDLMTTSTAISIPVQTSGWDFESVSNFQIANDGTTLFVGWGEVDTNAAIPSPTKSYLSSIKIEPGFELSLQTVITADNTFAIRTLHVMPTSHYICATFSKVPFKAQAIYFTPTLEQKSLIPINEGYSVGNTPLRSTLFTVDGQEGILATFSGATDNTPVLYQFIPAPAKEEPKTGSAWILSAAQETRSHIKC